MENLDRRMLLAGLGLVGAAAAASAGAGTLTPPAGPVLPTGKTTTEIEPRTEVNAANTPGNASCVFKITAPGSYYLSGNVIGASGKSGIVIEAINVTLDLNGFEVLGAPGSDYGVFGNQVWVRNVAIINGVVHGWGATGVSLAQGFAHNCQVRNVIASSNVDIGIRAGRGCTITNCVAYGNASHGIVGDYGSTITDCAAHENVDTGLIGGNGSTISNCTGYGNATGIAIRDGGTIIGSSARSNTGVGISVGIGSNVINCTAASNTGIGISGDDACAIVQCSATSNQGDGIAVKNGCSVQACQAAGNTLNGIAGLQSSTIRACKVSANTQNGIVAGDSSLIVDNHCDINGLAAGTQSNIYINGSSCRVDGNSVAGGDRGIATANGVGGNVIMRNSCRGGTNPYGGIAGGNDVGPIGTAATSTSPWANILF